MSASQKLLDAENRALKKRVLALEEELRRLKVQPSSSAAPAPVVVVPLPSPVAENPPAVVRSDAVDDEIRQLREELARSQAEASGYKEALESMRRKSQTADVANGEGIGSVAQEKRIRELEEENAALADMTIDSYEKYTKLLIEMNKSMTKEATRPKQERTLQRQSSSMSMQAGISHLSARVVSFSRSSDGEVTFHIEVEAIDTSMISWSVTRTYIEFRGLRKCVQLRGESK
jgi:hypothetical protein